MTTETCGWVNPSTPSGPCPLEYGHHGAHGNLVACTCGAEVPTPEWAAKHLDHYYA